MSQVSWELENLLVSTERWTFDRVIADPTARKAIIITCVIMLGQQLSGINAVIINYSLICSIINFGGLFFLYLIDDICSYVFFLKILKNITMYDTFKSPLERPDPTHRAFLMTYFRMLR